MDKLLISIKNLPDEIENRIFYFTRHPVAHIFTEYKTRICRSACHLFPEESPEGQRRGAVCLVPSKRHLFSINRKLHTCSIRNVHMEDISEKFLLAVMLDRYNNSSY